MDYNLLKQCHTFIERNFNVWPIPNHSKFTQNLLGRNLYGVFCKKIEECAENCGVVENLHIHLMFFDCRSNEKFEEAGASILTLAEFARMDADLMQGLILNHDIFHEVTVWIRNNQIRSIRDREVTLIGSKPSLEFRLAQLNRILDIAPAFVDAFVDSAIYNMELCLEEEDFWKYAVALMMAFYQPSLFANGEVSICSLSDIQKLILHSPTGKLGKALQFNIPTPTVDEQHKLTMSEYAMRLSVARFLLKKMQPRIPTSRAAIREECCLTETDLPQYLKSIPPVDIWEVK